MCCLNIELSPPSNRLQGARNTSKLAAPKQQGVAGETSVDGVVYAHPVNILRFSGSFRNIITTTERQSPLRVWYSINRPIHIKNKNIEY